MKRWIIYIIETEIGEGAKAMFIDMHMHEKTYSKDSFLSLDEIVQIAKEKGLGAVCIRTMTVWA